MNKQALLCAALALSVHAAQAVDLTTHQDHSVALPGTSALAQPWLDGELLNTRSTTFAYGAYYPGTSASGSIDAMVVRNKAGGTLDFYWQITNSAASPGNVGNLRIGNFGAAGTAYGFDANFRSDQGGDLAPTSAVKFSFGRSVNFQFFKPNDLYTPGSLTGQLTPGSTSTWVFLHTNATNYDMNAFVDAANMGATRVSGSEATFGPSNQPWTGPVILPKVVAGVPEPSTYAMLGLGLLAIGGVRRRRQPT